MLEMGASLKLFCTFSVSKQTLSVFCSLLFPLLIFVFFVCKLKNEQINWFFDQTSTFISRAEN